VGHESALIRLSNGRDLGVLGTDHRSRLFELAADRDVMVGGLVVERQTEERLELFIDKKTQPSCAIAKS
jgi:hypothetical protein